MEATTTIHMFPEYVVFRLYFDYWHFSESALKVSEEAGPKQAYIVLVVVNNLRVTLVDIKCFLKIWDRRDDWVQI